MGSFRTLLIRLLAAVLFVQSGVAAAHGLRGLSAGAPMLLEICTAEGMRQLRLDPEGSPLPTGEAGFCLACHGLPTVLLPAPPGEAGPAWAGVALHWVLPEAPAHAPARAPPYAPRGPPRLG